MPKISRELNEALNANGKSVVIKKNIFSKNIESHPDLSPDDSRKILETALYSTDLYGQNQKISRPYNWILIHLANKNSAIVVEINENKENLEIINWHFLLDDGLRKKQKQAEREGGANPHAKKRSCQYS